MPLICRRAPVDPLPGRLNCGWPCVQWPGDYYIGAREGGEGHARQGQGAAPGTARCSPQRPNPAPLSPWPLRDAAVMWSPARAQAVLTDYSYTRARLDKKKLTRAVPSCVPQRSAPAVHDLQGKPALTSMLAYGGTGDAPEEFLPQSTTSPALNHDAAACGASIALRSSERLSPRVALAIARDLPNCGCPTCCDHDTTPGLRLLSSRCRLAPRNRGLRTSGIAR